MLVRRADLFGQFRGLLAVIAEHPCLGREYLCSGVDLPDDVAEALERETEEEWETGLKDGRRGGERAHLDFVARRRAETGIRPDRAYFVEAYRTMLRTLEIPPEWP